jgi:hypothetical protein
LISASLDPSSKVKDESREQPLKQLRHSISTDAGMQIDFNPEQQKSASASIRFSFDPRSNVNDDSQPSEEKDRNPSVSISRTNVGFGSDPKYRTTVTPSTFIMKSPQTRKVRLPASTVICETPLTGKEL